MADIRADCREQARRLRKEAELTPYSSVKQWCLQMAGSYEVMAGFMEQPETPAARGTAPASRTSDGERGQGAARGDS